MGKELAEKYAVARETFAEADSALGYSLSQLCFEGPEDRLRLTEITQPAILTVSIAVQRVLAETSLGRPLEDALSDMADRIGSSNFSFIVTAVTIQNQVGGSLAGLFDMVSDTVRQRQQFSRKIRALTAMGRASAYVLSALPIVLAMLLTLINHNYMAPLFTTSAGHTLIIIGLVSMSIGSLILRKIVSFSG